MVKSFDLVPAPQTTALLAGEMAQPAPVRFSDQALQASIDKVLATMPEDRKALELEIDGDAKGVHVVGVFKTPDGWSVLGGVSYDKGASWGGQIAVRKEWK